MSVLVTNVKLAWENFDGKTEGGVRYHDFGMLVEDDKVSKYICYGWNVQEDKHGQSYIRVSINRRDLPSEEAIEVLKAGETYDVRVAPMPWIAGRKSGIKLYLLSIRAIK